MTKVEGRKSKEQGGQLGKGYPGMRLDLFCPRVTDPFKMECDQSRDDLHHTVSNVYPL